MFKIIRTNFKIAHLKKQLAQFEDWIRTKFLE